MYFCHSHILFSFLNKCPSDFNLSPFIAIQNIAANTLSLNLATKYRKVLTFLYSLKDSFCFHDKLPLEQFLLFNPVVILLQLYNSYLVSETGWRHELRDQQRQQVSFCILNPSWLNKSMVQICTTLGNCQSLLKGNQGAALALTQQKCLSPLQLLSHRECSLHLGHCPCAVTRHHLALNCQLTFGINSAIWAAEW